MRENLLKIQDSKGNIYTMPSKTPKCILEVHYSTSYYQFIVQDYIVDENGKELFPKKDIIVPINENNWADFIAVKEDEIGKILD